MKKNYKCKSLVVNYIIFILFLIKKSFFSIKKSINSSKYALFFIICIVSYHYVSAINTYYSKINLE